MSIALALVAMGFAATSVALAVKLYVDRGTRARAEASAVDANSRATAAELQNGDLASQLIRADAEKAKLRADLEFARAQRDSYRSKYIDALASTPDGAGRLLNELGGMPDVPDPSTEDRNGGEGGAVPDAPASDVATVPGRRPG